MDGGPEAPGRAAAFSAPDDELDIPAAVLCSACGRAECSGCGPALPEEAADAEIPWERQGRRFWPGLWRTARSSTVDGPAFFAALPDGSVQPALVFAVACELLAIGSLAIFALPCAYLAAPSLVEAIWSSGDVRRWALSAVALGVPAMAAMMVALHVIWGIGLELGLRRQGLGLSLRPSVRYALYACGWDLLTSPFGFIAGMGTGGPVRALAEMRLGVRVPRSATEAYLRTRRGAESAEARGALIVAALIMGSVVLAGAIGAVGVLVALASPG